MTLPSSGPISISQLRSEFGGPAPSPLSSYYNGGRYHGDGTSNVPATGVISLSQFRGANKYTFGVVSNGQRFKVYPGSNTLIVYYPDGRIEKLYSGYSAIITGVTGTIYFSLVFTGGSDFIQIHGQGVTELLNFPTDPRIRKVSFELIDDATSNLVKVPAILPPNITSLEKMFYACTSFNQNLSTWDVSKVTNMCQMFRHATSFNQPLASWNVSNVTDMNEMFMYATAFNQNLNQWCVSKITSAPIGFADYTTLFTSDKHPKWGTCPRGY